MHGIRGFVLRASFPPARSLFTSSSVNVDIDTPFTRWLSERLQRRERNRSGMQLPFRMRS
jgi:hypothetical protein